MSREHNKQLRTMKDGKRIALDTLSGVELLNSAHLCLQQNQGDLRYKARAEGIVRDALKVKGKNFYVTLPMRRTLMGFIRPVFDEEWLKRSQKQLSTAKLPLGGLNHG